MGCHETVDQLYITIYASNMASDIVNYFITNPPKLIWFHLAFTWDLPSRTMLVYVDGDNIGTDTDSLGTNTLLTAQGIPSFVLMTHC